MDHAREPAAASWAETAIEEAAERAEAWYRTLSPFNPRVNLGSVVGHKFPALLSEQDCVIHFARFLHKSGVRWDTIHHQVSVSRWLFDHPHPAATAGASRWCVDLALLASQDFLEAHLPATEPGFRFDACLEFAYLSDFWTEPGARRWGQPAEGRRKVQKDCEKIARYLSGGVCRIGYAIVFEDCDSGFSPTFAAEMEAASQCRVRFVRGYSTVDDMRSPVA